jgi:nitrate/nitrite transporter NarK
MPPRDSAMPPVLGIIFGIIWFLFMGGMIVAYIVMLIAAWRLMKAHEKIADKLNQLAEKFQLK